MKFPADKTWQRLIQQAEGLVGFCSNRISNAANLSALVYGVDSTPGPFQGNPACVSIELGNGVCGTAAVSGETLRVYDVDTFDGHIACDAAARSEVVVPLFKKVS